VTAFDVAFAAFAEAHQARVIEPEAGAHADPGAPGLPGWMQTHLAAREADEDRAGRRHEYDAWALRYADSGVRVPEEPEIEAEP
jgi:hypothetical protein